jgi:TetR/AcrR family transcriptional repressor of nem operon
LPPGRGHVGGVHDDRAGLGLAGDGGRDATKQAYTDGVLAMIDDVAARQGPDNAQSARVQTLSVFAMMIGTLQLSRALADRHLADAVLAQGIHNALALLGAERSN